MTKFRSALSRGLIALACTGASVVAVISFLDDRAARRGAAHLFETYAHDVRRPSVTELVDLAPRADWLGGIAADAVLDDVYGDVALGEATPEARQAWMELLPRIDEELEASRSILFDSVRSRPGWAMHKASLGQIEFALQRRGGRALEPELWRAPLDRAAAEAPGSDLIPVFHAAAEIELAAVARVRLDEARRQTIQRSFLDADFVDTALPATVAVVGIDEAIRLIPDDPAPLRRGFQYLASVGDVPRAAALWARYENAERVARELDLQEAERVARLADRARLLRLVRAWAISHSAVGFGEAGASQAVRLLAIWPVDDPGVWRRDPRTAFVTLLLSPGREMGAREGRVVWRAVAALDAVPESVRAFAMLRAGMIDEAQRLALRSDSAGSFEWTSFWAAAGKVWLQRGSRRNAEFAVHQISPAALEGCEALLIRHQLAAGGERRRIAAVLASRRGGRQRASVSGQLPLCLSGEDGALAVSLSLRAPALVVITWDGAEHEVKRVDGGGHLTVPLPHRQGQVIFALNAIAGPQPTYSAQLSSPK